MANKSTYKKRLLKLAAFLEALPPERFNLNIIGRTNQALELPSPETCGTAACAIGWTPVVFPKNCKFVKNAVNNRQFGNISVRKKGGRKRDFFFAQEFFGLDMQEAYYLFTPGRYPRRRRGQMTVANRIREFVAAKPSYETLTKTYY